MNQINVQRHIDMLKERAIVFRSHGYTHMARLVDRQIAEIELMIVTKEQEQCQK